MKAFISNTGLHALYTLISRGHDYLHYRWSHQRRITCDHFTLLSRAHQLNKLSIISPMHTIRSRLLSNKFTTHGTNAATQKPLSPLFHTVVIYIQLPTKKTPLSRPIPYTTQRDRNLISQKPQPNQIPNPHLAHFLPLNPSSTHPTKRGRCTPGPLGPRGVHPRDP